MSAINKIGIFIPCYNVANSIEEVLGSFSETTLNAIDQIVVTDNCSQDKTLDILLKVQSTPGALGRRLVIIKNARNYGLGGSQKIAYEYFIKNKFTHFMIIHGDNQGDGEQIAQGFLKQFKQNPQVDFMVASRFMPSSDTTRYDRKRVMGNHLFNFLTFLFTGQRISDSGAGIVFIRTEVLKTLPYEHLTNSFQFNSLLTILFYTVKGIKIIVIPIVWRDSKDKSNISPLNYCWTLLKILMRYSWNKNILKKEGWQTFHEQSQKIPMEFSIIEPS